MVSRGKVHSLGAADVEAKPKFRGEIAKIIGIGVQSARFDFDFSCTECTEHDVEEAQAMLAQVLLVYETKDLTFMAQLHGASALPTEGQSGQKSVRLARKCFRIIRSRAPVAQLERASAF